ncbi:MAG: TerB family tellurite resistance protein, partial [Erysipelotrichaceae bacterium]|nr:TerB family tellurite resistance protein [Erysipelotrichaceae bacterium]
MAKFDLSKLKEASKAAANLAKETASKYELEDKVKKFAATATEVASDATQKATEAFKTFTEGTEEIAEGCITVKGALKLMYLVMACDNDLKSEELSTFNEIGRNLDPNYDSYQVELLDVLGVKFNSFDKVDFELELHDYAKDIVNEETNVKGANVLIKLVLWNLLAIAYSDDDCSEEELKLIRHIARLLNIDKSITAEMIATTEALVALEKAKK